MKKVLFTLLVSILMINYVYAQSCTVVSGTGKELGDEISCGTENFYVLEYNNDSVKMLAKYNLNVGDKIDYIEADEDITYEYSSQAYENCTNICNQLAQEKGFDYYYTYPIAQYIEDSNRIKLNGCRIYQKINEDRVHQDSRAIGTKIINGKSVLPLYGITYMEPDWGYEPKINHTEYTIEYDTNGNLIINNTPFKKYFIDYKAELNRQNINVNDISFVTMDKIIEILESTSGKNIERNLFFPPFNIDNLLMPEEEQLIGKMDIKEYVKDKYKWLYSITYWLGSGYKENGELDGQVDYLDYYISNEGFLCALGRGNCAKFIYPIGHGVRPMVTLSASNIKLPFIIQTQTDGNGNIEVVPSAYENETITFKVTPKPNYKLTSVKVTDTNGNTITYQEEDIINNKDNTITINKFTMPSDNYKCNIQI